MILSLLGAVVGTVLAGLLITFVAWYALRHGLFGKILEEQGRNREFIARIQARFDRVDNELGEVLPTARLVAAELQKEMKGGLS